MLCRCQLHGHDILVVIAKKSGGMSTRVPDMLDTRGNCHIPTTSVGMSPMFLLSATDTNKSRNSRRNARLRRERHGGSVLTRSLQLILSLRNALPLVLCIVAVCPGRAAGIPPEEFMRLPEDRQRAALFDGVENNQRRYANISLKTTSRVQIVNVDARTKKTGKILEDMGSDAFELRRIEGSYRMALNRYRPGVREPVVVYTDHYNAESGVNRHVSTERLAGKDQIHGVISTEHVPSFVACRYLAYLGGFSFVESPENDFLRFLLRQRKHSRIRGVDLQSGLVEASFTYTFDKPFARTGSITMWFDLSKDWLLTRRVWEGNNPKDPSDKKYERFEVNESKVFDGIWMPTRFTDVTLASGGGLPTPVGNLWETTAEDIKIGRVKKEDLEVAFPEGALVRDDITGKRWGVGKSEAKVAYNENVGGGPNGLVAQPPLASESSSRQRLVLVIGLSSAIVVLTSVFWYRRVQRSRR